MYKRVKIWSLFLKLFVSLLGITFFIIALYIILFGLGVISRYAQTISNGNIGIRALTELLIVLIVVSYVVLSVCNILWNRADEDCRIHCLPILMTPIFLITENGLLHLFDGIYGAYYPTMMGVFSSTAVAVITFASLKFSFGISAQQKRFREILTVKPKILVTENKVNGSNNYAVNITENDCYLCGVYIGHIEKVSYVDTAKIGSKFTFHDVIYPNKKVKFFQKETEKERNENGIKEKSLEEVAKEIFGKRIGEVISESNAKGFDAFLIFRDMANYYYLIRIPSEDKKSFTVGASEYTMMKLVRKYNNKRQKSEKLSGNRKSVKAEKTFIYCAMDLIGMPYNFYADEEV